jgi:peptidoglycan/LPS O-acetylase OafA/YrhL
VATAEPRAPRYESLDFWRGVACLSVLINHAVWYVPREHDGLLSAMAQFALRGWAGVPIFFVISGYCIAAACDNHRRKSGAVSAYFWKRFRRIYPPYWLVLFTSAVVLGLGDVVLHGAIVASQMPRPWWFSPWQWFGGITLTELWRYHLIGGPKGLFLGHAWTLCYEEQFYAVTGVLLLLCPRRFFSGIVLTTLGVGAVVFWGRSAAAPIDGFFFDGSWFQFAMGVFVYYAQNYGRPALVALTSAGLGIVAVWAAAAGAALLEPAKNDAQVYLVASLFALAAIGLRRWDAAIVSSKVLRPITACGVMCYSLYLIHLPVVTLVEGLVRAAGLAPADLSPLVSIPLCAIPSLLVSAHFHRSVERRFMSAGSRRSEDVRRVSVAADGPMLRVESSL